MKRAMERGEALAAATEFVERISDVVDRIEPAGSLRRGRAFTNDVEILCIPKRGPLVVPDGMFSATVEGADLLAVRMDVLLESGVIQRPPMVQGESWERQPPWGPRWKQFIYESVPFDLFVACPNTWGRQFVTRTGPGEFSKALVTERPGGFKPMGLQLRDGGVFTGGGTMIPVPEEIDYFRVLEVEWLEPEERDDWEKKLGREGKRFARVHPAVENYHLK